MNLFRAPFSIKGRIRRTEFGISYIIYVVIYVLIVALTGTDGSPDYSPVFFILMVPVAWFLWAQGAKRCHDRGNSGWYQIIPFYVLWMLFADSESGPNYYAPNPKGIGNRDEINDIGRRMG